LLPAAPLEGAHRPGFHGRARERGRPHRVHCVLMPALLLARCGGPLPCPSSRGRGKLSIMAFHLHDLTHLIFRGKGQKRKKKPPPVAVAYCHPYMAIRLGSAAAARRPTMLALLFDT